MPHPSLTALCSEGSVRLLVGEDYDFYDQVTDYDSFYYSGGQLARGRVEVCVEETWGTVCGVGFDDSDASVVCKQLGFSPYGEFCHYVNFRKTVQIHRPICIENRTTYICNGEENVFCG